MGIIIRRKICTDFVLRNFGVTAINLCVGYSDSIFSIGYTGYGMLWYRVHRLWHVILPVNDF